MNTALATGDETAIQPATLRGQTPLQLTPAADRATVSILKFTVTAAHRAADGTQHLQIVSGDIRLCMVLPPDSPAVCVGQRYCIEQARGECPINGSFIALYPDPASQPTYH
ncbi:hypothetical protein CO615_04575 [Lysobacteraceae bacterium NML75-0749]|nr:hypothetical protein CO615_04575 [Xanthomonadaceae bacterium NML75-0749]